MKDRTGLSVLPALLLLCEGLSNNSPDVIKLVQKTICGAIMEHNPEPAYAKENYYKIVQGKMVAYGLFLYYPILECVTGEDKKALNIFLKQSFLVSQIVNDFYDREEDKLTRQPNFWNIFTENSESEMRFIDHVKNLINISEMLSDKIKPYSWGRIADITNYILNK